MNPRFADQDNIFFQEILSTLRSAGMLMPFAILSFGLLVRFGYLDDTYYHSDAMFAVLAIAFTVLGVTQYILKPISAGPQAIILTLYHILGIAFLLFVSGFYSPFLVCWALILIAADTYFGTRAFALSCMILFVTAWLSFALYPSTDQNFIIAAVVTCVFLATIGVVISRIRTISDNERRALNKVRVQENFQRERLLALVNSMGDAVVTTDQKGVIRIYNAATLSLLDTNENLTGITIDKLLHLVDQSNHPIKLLEEAQKRKSVFTRNDLSTTFKDGETMKVYINVSPIRRGYRSKGETGYIIIMRDITKEKTLEEERDEFISVVSHELRTPIAITEGNLSNVKFLMQRGTDAKTLTAAIDDAHEQTLYLAKMINDLSTLSRAERGVADAPEPIDVADMIHTMYKEYNPQATAKGLHLDLDLSPKLPSLQTSRLYLEEMMQNLITNAIKYTTKGSVTVSAQKIRGGIEFSVKDTGIGISKSDQKHLFEKFFRSEDYRTRETSGTGLGLYVVRKLAEKLSTQVEFVSRLNHGSTFSFTIKLADKEEK